MLALIVFDFVVIGGLIACRNQSQRDTYFQFHEVKSGFVGFVTTFRVTMNFAIVYILSKDAPTKSKGLFLAHSSFWENFAVMVAHGVNMNFVMKLLCLRLDISDKDTPSPSTQVSHSDDTGFLKNLTLNLSIASVIAVVAALTLYWRFGPEVCFELYLIFDLYGNLNQQDSNANGNGVCLLTS